MDTLNTTELKLLELGDRGKSELTVRDISRSGSMVVQVLSQPNYNFPEVFLDTFSLEYLLRHCKEVDKVYSKYGDTNGLCGQLAAFFASLRTDTRFMRHFRDYNNGRLTGILNFKEHKMDFNELVGNGNFGKVLSPSGKLHREYGWDDHRTRRVVMDKGTFMDNFSNLRKNQGMTVAVLGQFPQFDHPYTHWFGVLAIDYQSEMVLLGGDFSPFGATDVNMAIVNVDKLLVSMANVTEKHHFTFNSCTFEYREPRVPITTFPGDPGFY